MSEIFIVMRRDGSVCADGEWRPSGDWYADKVFKTHPEANRYKNGLLHANYEPYFDDYEIRVKVVYKVIENQEESPPPAHAGTRPAQ